MISFVDDFCMHSLLAYNLKNLAQFFQVLISILAILATDDRKQFLKYIVSLFES